MKPGVALVVAALSAASLGAQAPVGTRTIDWDWLRPEILERYRALVQIDTTAGRETLAVDYLKRTLEAEGIPTKTFSLDPARANLVARIKGNGLKRPLLILAHTDVVGVDREKWPVDPFGAVIEGRGHLGARQQGRQAGARRESHRDVDVEAARSPARSRRDFPR